MLEGRTVWELVERRADATPDALFGLDESQRSLSFAEYRAAAERTAAGLYALGVGEESSVSWILPTRLSALVLMAALARLGAVQNPIIPIYRQREVGFCVRQTGAELLLVPRTFRGFDYPAMARELERETPGLATEVVEPALPEGEASSLPPRPRPREPSRALVRWIFYTSGTTADPKGARHTDAALLTSSRGLAQAMDLRPDDRIGLVFPVTHLGGANSLIAGLLSGCAHLVVEVFDPETTVPFLSANGVTHAGAGNVFHRAYLEAQRARGPDRIFPRIRAFQGGGAPKPPQLHFALEREVGAGILSAYGLTECPIIAIGRTSDPSEKLAHSEGRPNPASAEIRVVRSDGTPAAPGEEGELRVRGPQLCRGYVDPALDREAFDAEGFFCTGDLGHVDEDGYVSVSGRLKDVIIRKGENISAREVEDLLLEHPKVGDAAVVGLPDPECGERCCAVVTCRSPSDPLSFQEMAAFLREKQLMVQKIPEQLEIVTELPRNLAGKVVKRALRDRFVLPD